MCVNAQNFITHHKICITHLKCTTDLLHFCLSCLVLATLLMSHPGLNDPWVSDGLKLNTKLNCNEMKVLICSGVVIGF